MTWAASGARKGNCLQATRARYEHLTHSYKGTLGCSGLLLLCFSQQPCCSNRTSILFIHSSIEILQNMNIFKWILVGMCKHFPVVINHSVLQNRLAFSRNTVNHSPISIKCLLSQSRLLPPQMGTMQILSLRLRLLSFMYSLWPSVCQTCKIFSGSSFSKCK